MRVDEDGNLVQSSDVTNILVEKFSIATKKTGGYNSQINGNNEKYNTITKNMIILGLIDSDKHEKNGVVQQKNHLKYID